MGLEQQYQLKITRRNSKHEYRRNIKLLVDQNERRRNMSEAEHIKLLTESRERYLSTSCA